MDSVTGRERERRALVAGSRPDGPTDARRWLADLTELADLLRRLTGEPEGRSVTELLDAALMVAPAELDRRLGLLDLDSQDAFAELVGAFPRVSHQLPNLRMLANSLHAKDCPCYDQAAARHVERLLLLRAAHRSDAALLADDALVWLEERAVRF
jgi:hypothetical protein